MARQMTRVLASEAQYEQALDEIERYFENEPTPGTPEAARFDELARAIDEYESVHWPIPEEGHAKVKQTPRRSSTGTKQA